MSSDEPLVTVIILNWNSYEHTSECIRGLKNQDYENLEILVVDNYSTDGSWRFIREEFESVDVLRNSRNLGFAGGMNRGIEEALDRDSDYILITNSDIRLPDSTTVSKLVSRIRANPSIGALSPRTSLDSDSRWELHNYLSYFRNGRNRRKQFDREIQDDALSYDCHYSFVIFSREILELVGTFDHQYFLYMEDIDHGARIEDAGYYLATDERVQVKHESHGSSDSPISALPSYYEARNRLLFMREYNSRWEYSYLLPMYIWWLSTRFVYRIYKQRHPGALALLHGVIDGMRGKTGKGPYP